MPNNNKNNTRKIKFTPVSAVHKMNELGSKHRWGEPANRNNMMRVSRNMGKIRFDPVTAKLVANALKEHNDPENALEWVLNQNNVDREYRRRAAMYLNSVYLNQNINNVNYGLYPKPLKKQKGSRKLVERNRKAHSRVHNYLSKALKNKPGEGK